LKGRNIYKLLKADNLVATVEETWGFEYLAEKGFGKDLSGFEYGPANPKSEEAKKTAVLIGEEDAGHISKLSTKSKFTFLQMDLIASLKNGYTI
jgi:deferrochelatase/peroxidase EfeB